MKATFTVTYEIVTNESAANGDIEESGIISESVSLREAIEDLFKTRTNQVSGVESIEANEWPIRSPRWITVSNGMEYESGEFESRSIHFPESLSDASRVRLARLIRGR